MAPRWHLRRILLFGAPQRAPFRAGEIAAAASAWGAGPATPEPRAPFAGWVAVAAGDAGCVAAVFGCGCGAFWGRHWFGVRGLFGDGAFESVCRTVER